MDNKSFFTNFLEKVGGFSSKNSKLVILASIMVVLTSLIGVSQVSMSMGMDLYIDEDSQINEDWQRLQSEFGKGNEVFIVLDTKEKEIYDPDVMEDIETFSEELYSTELFTFVTTPAHPVKSGPGQGNLLNTTEENYWSVSATMDNHRTANEMINSLIPDNNTGVVIAQYGNIDLEEYDDSFFGFLPVTEEEVVKEEVDNILENKDFSTFDTTVTGAPVFENAAFGLMLPEMVGLFGYAFLIIVGLVFLIMHRKVESKFNVFLPFITTISTLILMVGFMGVVGYEFNAIMLGVMPISLGLGIDYSLQIQTRFLEEKSNGKSSLEASRRSVKYTGKALAFAMGTTLIGLGSLLISDVPPVRQFGATAGFSIFVAMVFSVTFLIALLTVFDKGGVVRFEEAKSKSFIEKATCCVSEKVCGSRKFVLLVTVLALTLGAFAYPNVSNTQEMLDYWPDIQERQDIRDLESTVDSPNIVQTFVEFEENAYTPEKFREVEKFEEEAENLKHVNTVLSPVRALEMGGHEVPDEQATLDELLEDERSVDRPPVLGKEFSEVYPETVLVQLFVEDIEGKPVRELIDSIYDVGEEELENSELRVTGKPVLNRNVIENVTSGLTEMTLLSFGLVFVFLAFAIKSFKYSGILLGSVSVSAVLMVAASMYLFNVPWNPLTVTVASIILGVGVDYGVHVYERFLEEKENTESSEEAIKTALTKKARPILGSGLTTMFGFGVLLFSDFPVLANFGKAILFAMAFSIIATFVVLPSVILVFDS